MSIRNENTSHDDDLVQRLMSKVTEQARELSLLSTELNESKQIIYHLNQNKSNNIPHNHDNTSYLIQHDENNPNYLTTSQSISKDAQKKRYEKEHKDQILALERQLSHQQHRYNELSKQKNNLLIENEKLKKEKKFYEKSCNELQQEVQKLRHQLETINHKFGLNQSTNHSGKNSTMNLFDEMKYLKGNSQQLERDKNQLIDENNELKLKIKVLEDALEFHVDEMGLSGHGDLLTKISYLKGEITALRKDLMNKNHLVEDLEHEKTSIKLDHDTLQQQIQQLQQHLLETKSDLNRSKQLLNIPSSAIIGGGGRGAGAGAAGGGVEAITTSASVGTGGEMNVGTTSIVNALDQIKSLEQERDLLIEFIQNDLPKSSILQSELHEIKLQNKLLLEEKERYERQHTSLQEKYQKKSTKYEEISKEFLDVENKLKIIERERNEYEIRLKKREEEIHELYEMNTNLTTQVSEYENKNEKINREIHHIRADNQNQSMTIDVLTKDCDLWKTRYEEIEKLHYQTSTELQEIKPRLLGIESEYKRLYHECDRLQKDRENSLQQLTQYKDYSHLKEEISQELESIRDYIYLKEFSSISQKGNISLTTSSGKKTKKSSSTSTGPPPGTSSNTIHIRDIVEKHGLWCGIPSIRTFHPILGEYIRIIYQDLHDTYVDFQHLQDKYHHLEEEHSKTTIKLHELQNENFSSTEKLLFIDEMKKKQEITEREWNRLFEEIKLILISSIQLMESSNKANLRLISTSASASGSASKNQNNFQKNSSKFNKQNQRISSHDEDEMERGHDPSAPYEPFHDDDSDGDGDGNGDIQPTASRGSYPKKQQRNFDQLRDDEIQLEDLLDDYYPNTSPSLPPPSTNPSSRGKEGIIIEDISSPINKRGQEHRSEDILFNVDSIHNLPLTQLPSILSQLLIHNITLANNYPILKNELHQLQQSNTILLHKTTSTHAINTTLQQSIRQSQEQVANLHETKKLTEEELRHQAEEATDLVEKQNALIMTLEAKLTEMRRKMLLKGSQVTSLQQRELTIQKKLYQILLHVYENISIQFTIPLPSVPNSNFQSTTSCPTSSSSSVASLPELLNITRNCFEDIIKWEGQLKFNQLQPSKRVYEEDEDESPLTQRSIEKGVTSQREQFFRRKPPTIPRR